MKYWFYIFILFTGISTAQDRYLNIRTHLHQGQTEMAQLLIDSLEKTNQFSDSSLYYGALCAIQLHDWQLAKKKAMHLQKEFKNFGETDFLFGMVYYLHEDYGRSTEAFNKVLKKNSDHLKALFNRAMAFGQAGNYNYAIEDLALYLQKNPNDPQAWYAKAYWHEYLEQYKEAIANYERCIQLHPKLFDAYIGLAFCWSKLNNRTKACEIIERSIQQGSQIGVDLKTIYCH